jgi:hypothetical protein
MGLFAMCDLGLGISLFPYVVPWSVTLWDAASSPGVPAFLLVDTLVILPIVFMYTGWSYYVFRGQVRAQLWYRWGDIAQRRVSPNDGSIATSTACACVWNLPDAAHFARATGG